MKRSASSLQEKTQRWDPAQPSSRSSTTSPSAPTTKAPARPRSEVLLSAGMFHLGDQLRRQSHALSELDADDETLEVIDEARTQIARTILLLDQAETAQAKERR